MLKNEGDILPLGKGVHSIAVIGPNAADAVIEGGGSSKVPPLYRVSPLEGLKKQVGSQVRIEYESGSDNVDEPFTIPDSWLPGGLHGVFYETADFSGEPIDARDGFGSDFWWHIAWTPLQIKPVAMRWTGSLTVPADGAYKIAINHLGRVSFSWMGMSSWKAWPGNLIHSISPSGQSPSSSCRPAGFMNSAWITFAMRNSHLSDTAWGLA